MTKWGTNMIRPTLAIALNGSDRHVATRHEHEVEYEKFYAF